MWPRTPPPSEDELLILPPNLVENKRLLVPHGVDRVGRGGPLGAVLLLGVARETDDFHLHARFHALVRQELARVNLARREVKQDMKAPA